VLTIPTKYDTIISERERNTRKEIKTMTKTVKTVAELMEMLKNLDPNTEVHCMDSDLGWSNVKVDVNETDGVTFEGE